MAVTSSDIRLYKASVNNDTASNGGKINTAAEITSGVAQNIHPNLTDEERNAELEADRIRFRKVFLANRNAEDLGWMNTFFWIHVLSTAADWFRLKAGTDTDVQSAASAYTGWAGTGELNADASLGASSIAVNYDAADGVNDGDTIRIDDGTNVEYHVVSGAPAWAGTVATITLTGTLANAFTTADGTLVATCVDTGDLKPSSDSWTETSASGTYDEAGNPLTLYNEGTITESWTLTFTGATSFSVAGASVGAVGTGSTGTDFQPSNGTSSYFKIAAAGWGGTWTSGDTITFDTVHAAQGIWIKEIWSAGVASATGNTVTYSAKGESE